ncbi:MAG: hypothetical protein ACNA8W_06355 [Bradymonadaceae bacterium]
MKNLLLMAALGLLIFGCEDRQAPPETSSGEASLTMPSEDEGGAFFDEGLLLEGAVDIRDHAPECVGATPDELERPDHPAMIRGQVLAPAARLARRSIVPDWLVPSAYAAALEGELPVVDARVALYAREKGEPTGNTIVETRTNIAGAWCLRIPDEFKAGLDLILVASSRNGRARLRRLFVLPGDVDISPLSEAFTQILVEDEIDLDILPPATFLNMEILAGTAVDLLAPVVIEEGDQVAQAVTKIKKTLRRDERFAAIIARQ